MKYLTLPETAPDTFWDRVEVTGFCWNWIGALNRNGYGSVKIKQKSYSVHRLAYRVLVGEIPDGMQLDHLCRNRRCVNPDHLESVSLKENLFRGFGIAATHKRKTECHRGHPFDEANTYVLDGGRKRQCRACRSNRT